MQAAIDLIDQLASEQAYYNLFDYVDAKTRKPVIIAPACQVADSNNALAIGYAEWLSKQTDWPVEDRVFQKKSVSRDQRDAWTRIAHRCEFYGEIDTSVDYVIVDDVITLGGTLADLRSFILGKGGRVIAMSAIASRSGRPSQIRLGNDTRSSIERLYGKHLAEVCDVLEFSHDGLTEAEGARVADCYNHVDLRKKILRARNA